MRLLIASITNAPPEILAPHLETILWQHVPEGWIFDVAYIVDPDAADASIEVLEEAGVAWQRAGAKPEGARYAVSEDTHEWSVPTFHWLAREKQKILDSAQAAGFDAVFLVDSDLLLAPRTIASLIACEKPVVSGVFWTRWTPDQAPAPQVWLQHPYGFNGLGLSQPDFLDRLHRRKLQRVLGLGACTLIRSNVIDRARYWPLLDLPSGGMWQGEDRHFSVRCQRTGIDLWADAWPEIFHVYRPSDVQRIPAAMAALSEPGADSISAIIEPLEEPNLTGYQHPIRGKLSHLALLPEIKEALASLSPGDEAVRNITFPPHWPVYAGQQRVLRLRLLDACSEPAADRLRRMR